MRCDGKKVHLRPDEGLLQLRGQKLAEYGPKAR